MGISDGKLLYCHSVAEGNVDKKISTLDYNNRTFYDWFNNPFTSDFGSPDLHLPPITIDNRPRLHKRARYTPDLLPYAISVASEDYVSTLTTPSDSPDLLPSDDLNTLYVMKKYVPLKGGVNRGYYCRENGRIRCYRNTRFYCSTCSDNDKKFYYCRGFYRIISKTRTCFLEHQHSMSQLFGWLLRLSPFHPLPV